MAKFYKIKIERLNRPDPETRHFVWGQKDGDKNVTARIVAPHRLGAVSDIFKKAQLNTDAYFAMLREAAVYMDQDSDYAMIVEVAK